MTFDLTVKIEEPELIPKIEAVGAQLIGYLSLNAKSDDPKTAAQIVNALGLTTDSVVQDVVHSLRGHHATLVASRCHRPYGYWLAKTPDEIKETMDQLYSRAMSNLFAWSGLKRGLVSERQWTLF